MILNNKNNNQGVFLELLVAAKSAIIQIPDSRIQESEKWAV